MRIRMPVIVSFLCIAVMLVMSGFALGELPDNARIAVHFDINGAANGFADKWSGLFMMPAVALVFTAIFAVIPRFEPRRFNLASSWKFYCTGWIGGIAVVTAAHGLIVLGALHNTSTLSHLVPPMIGLLYIALGNYLGKTRANFFAGIRTPWTLSSDYSWEKTHRLTGRLFVLSGLLTVIASFLLSTKQAFEIMIASVLISTLIGVAASYLYWRHDPLRHASDGVPE